MNQLGRIRINFNFDSPIRTDFHFLLCNDFGRRVVATDPPANRTGTAPTVPTGIPSVVRGIPPISPAIEPVPASGRIPIAVVRGSQDLVLHFGLGDWCAKVVLRLDRCGNLLAQRDRFGRCIDRHFVFRLLVLFDPEAAPLIEGCHHQQCITSEHGPLGNGEFPFDTAKLVRLEDLLEDLFPLGVVDLDREILFAKRGRIRLVVL